MSRERNVERRQSRDVIRARTNVALIERLEISNRALGGIMKQVFHGSKIAHSAVFFLSMPILLA